jgi:tetratricopeptide (TPR) repeat protein
VFNTAQWALSDLGVALLALGERGAAVAAFERAAAASEEVGDAAGVVLASLGRGTIAQIDGDTSSARPLFEQAVRGLTRLATPLWGGHALAGLAWCDWRDGLLDDASERYTRVHAAGERYGEPTLVATGLEGLARVAVAASQHEAAKARLRQAAEVRQAAARPAPPHEQREIDELWAQVDDDGSGVTALMRAPRTTCGRQGSSRRRSGRRAVQQPRTNVRAGEHRQHVGDGHRPGQEHGAGARVGDDRLDPADVPEPSGHLPHAAPAAQRITDGQPDFRHRVSPVLLTS